MTDYEQIIAECFKKIVLPMVKYPKDVHVRCFAEGEKYCIESRFHYADNGKIIGNDKTNFNALSNLVFLIGVKSHHKIHLNNPIPSIVGNAEPRTDYKADKNWNVEPFKRHLTEVLQMFLSHQFELGTVEAGDETRFKIYISNAEKLPYSLGDIAFALSKIFHAIGRKMGRKVYITADAL